MKAFLKNHRQTPRKTRLVADLVRGKQVDEARAALTFTDKKSASIIKTLIDSAVANAKQLGANMNNLFVQEIRVDEGIKLKRYKPRERGRAAPYKRRTSHVQVTLGEKEPKTAK